MFDFYEGRVFRPPSEAASLIVQGTIGCSHNKCAFCEMYKEKRFRIRPEGDVIADLELARGWSRAVRRIFFADGDAFVRGANSQLEIMRAVSRIYPECERVSMYASPKSILAKTDEELRVLREAGIALVYMGLETGDDALLKKINKGATCGEIVSACLRARAAGIAVSVTAISGLAGREGSMEHARGTAVAISEMKPEFFSLLSLMLEPGSEMFDDFRAGRFAPMSATEILLETRELLSLTDSPGTVFRANHASNYVDLRGTLNADRQRMLLAINAALENRARIKPENFRRL